METMNKGSCLSATWFQWCQYLKVEEEERFHWADNNVDGRALLQWLVLRYAVPNLEVIKAAIGFAKQEGLSVSLDLASFEPHLVLGLISQLIKVHTCFSILKFLFYVLDDLLTNSSSN
ncbi:hypothetical protein Bca4012_015778 [Brassica carinata]